MPREHRQAIELDPASRDDRGTLRDAAAELPDLPYVRLTQRERPPRDRRNLWLLLALVLVAHGVVVWLGYLILRPMVFPPNDLGVLAVTLIEPTSSLPPPPPLLMPPPVPGQAAPAPPPRRLHYVPPAKGAMSATMQGVKGPPLDLYGPNGQIRLPPGTSAPASAPAYATPEIQGSQIYSGKSPVPYKPTRFNQDWAPDHESLGSKTIGRAVDKAIEKTTVKKTIHLPGGMKVQCQVSPLLAFAGGLLGCSGTPPQPPPKNDNDIRLSMPPAETLTGKKVVVPKPATSTAAPGSSG